MHHGWVTEEDNRTEKNLLGLDHYQVRTWTAWHHNIVICMLAHAFLAAQQARLVREHRDRAAAEAADQGKAPRPRAGPPRQVPTG